MGKTKIAILGGGVGAMSTAFELTSEANWQERYEITIYQMGWRLGGKGASGRNAAMSQRIEEHGLHFWLGFYENAFRMIRQCYAENARPLTDALATWSEAFKPCNEVTVEDHVNGEWIPWLLTFTPNPDTPGDTEKLPSLWEILGTTIEFLRNLLVKSKIPGQGAGEHELFAGKIAAFLGAVGMEGAAGAHAGEQLLRAVSVHVRKTAERGGQHDPQAHELLRRMLETYRQWLARRLGQGSTPEEAADQEEWRRFWIMSEFALVNIIGVIADGVLVHGFSAINQYDYKEWLTRHGASDTVANCGLVQSFYDLFFSPYTTVEAGTYLKGISRILFTYRGAVYWRMQAGMGDTIFAPLYEVLKKRGVQFRFFHKVQALHLSQDGKSVASIDMARQATVKAGEYEPLVKVRRLPCWPSEPLYEQLVQGEELKERSINLESNWADWQNVEPLTLLRGQDFDQVVFGISLGSIPMLCGELLAASPAWQAMVDNVQTTATQAFQAWLLADTAGLGWPYWQNELPLVSAFTEPMDTFADMSHLLIREEWPADATPQSIAYFCGPMPDVPLPPPTEYGFPASQAEAVYQTSLAFMNESCGKLLPRVQRPGGGCDFGLLADAARGEGEARFRAQWFRANVDPSERYVITVKGSTKYRLAPAASGFENLFLAGDWTDNGINAGCVEAATTSGMQAAAGILGRPSRAVGEKFGEFEAD